MHDRFVQRGHGDHNTIPGLKFVLDWADSINRIDRSIVVGTVVIRDHNISSRQAGNRSAGNGSVYNTGTIPVVDCTTRGYLPNA